MKKSQPIRSNAKKTVVKSIEKNRKKEAKNSS